MQIFMARSFNERVGQSGGDKFSSPFDKQFASFTLEAAVMNLNDIKEMP